MLVKITKVDGTLKAMTTNGDTIPFNTPGKDYPTIWKNTAQKAWEEGMSFVLKVRIGKGERWEKVSTKAIDRMMADELKPADLPQEQLELMSFITRWS